MVLTMFSPSFYLKNLKRSLTLKTSVLGAKECYGVLRKGAQWEPSALIKTFSSNKISVVMIIGNTFCNE